MKFKKNIVFNKNSRKFRMSAFVFAITMLLSVVFAASCSFMEDDEFFGKIENEVAVANADKMSVYIRYANTRFGKTSPADAGYYTAKNNVAFTVSATTNTDYGFFKWAAFSTKNFNPSEQYSALVYNNDEEYNELFAPLELPETIVKFSSKNSQSTEVTIYATRDDIWLIPIVVNRPVISSTFPVTSSNPVRNASLRIQFSKPMDEASFKGNYSVGEGNLTGEFELNLQDITDLFEIKLSESKKLVTFSFKNEVIKGVNRYETGFNASSNVQISFTEDITDIYGYKMASSASVNWRIGTTYDRAAPIIEKLTGGIGSNFTEFASVDTPQAMASTSNLADYSAATLAQRSTGKVNFYVYATDIAAKENSAKQESDVQMIGFRATSLTDMYGTSLDGSAEGNYISQKYETYAPALNYSEVEAEFSTLMPGKGEGCLYTYDLSSLPDGLIKIDIWAMDMTGNNGLDNYDPDIVYDNNHNGYRSIFVVKDTHSPAIDTEKDKVRSSSESAPYGWYNGSSINPIKMNETAPIVDLGNEKLRSPHDKIKWMFRLGADTNWSVTTDDASWKLLTTPATPYEVGLARVDSEGLVSITMRLMDDLGNIADPVAISSAYYDETPPVISALSWVNSDGTLALNATKDSTLSQILKIPFTEEKSGIKRIEIKVEDSSGSNVPNALAGATISYSTDSAPSGAAEVTYDTSDPAHTGSVLVFTDSVTTGNLYVSGLNIRNSADETFTVKVKLLDAAINSGDKETNIKCDITDPVVKDVSVVGLSPRATKNGSADGVTKWLPYSAYDTATQQAVKARVSVNVEESCSGIYEIKLGEDAYLTDSSYITIGDTALAVGTDFSLNVAANTILMSDMFSPKLKGDDITFIIENVKIDNDNSTVKVSVKDFGLNGGDKSLPNVMKDSTSPAIDSIVLSDRGEASGTLPSVADADGTRYTNDRIVDLTINGAKDGDAGSGLRGIVLDSGATFTDTTTITVEISGSSSNCAFTKTDDKTVTFDTAYAYDSTVSFVIKNISLDSNTDGVKTVKAHLFDMCGWKSEVKTDSIILDTTPPGWLDKWIYVADSGNVAGEIYPATGAIGVEAGASGEPYFYTKNANTYLSVSYSDANFYGSKYSTTKTAALEILSDSSSVDLTGSASLEFPALLASGSTMYSIVLRDKAGNVSLVKSFHAVSDVAITKDTGSPAVSLTNRMAKLDSRSDYKVYLEGPSHRNRFSTSGTTGADDYKVYISVSLADYTEKTYTTSQSGLAKFAINDSSTAAPSESGSGTDFNKWIPYSAASGDEIKVWIPSDDNLRGPYYLWLMDNVGNTNSVQIRTPANESAGNNETWLGKASVNQIGTIDYVGGTATAATNELYGTLVTSNFDDTNRGADTNLNVTYYKDTAKFGFTYNENESGIKFSGTSSAAAYPVRFALVKKSTQEHPAKSEVGAWIYPDSVSDTAYTFTNEAYPQADYEYLYYIIEDAVGNVSTGLFQPETSVLSKWKYDAAAPSITVADGSAPNAITSANIQTLVPSHYGVQAFVDGTKVWVPASGDKSDSVTPGEKTYHKTSNTLYFDLALDEATQIKEYCYTTSAADPDSADWISTKPAASATNYFKVDTCIPTTLLSPLSSETDLYLHVRDILGNAANCKLSELKWQLDSVKPVEATDKPWADSAKTYLSSGNYYIRQEDKNGTDLAISVAFSDASSKKDEGVKVYLPSAWFSDPKSAVYGYSWDEMDVSKVLIENDASSSDNGKPYLQFTKAQVNGNLSEKPFYVYDHTGNYTKVLLSASVDSQPPQFDIDFTIYSGSVSVSGTTYSISGQTGSIFDATKEAKAPGTSQPAASLEIPKTFKGTSNSESPEGYSEANPYVIYSSAMSTLGVGFIGGTFTATDWTSSSHTQHGGLSNLSVWRYQYENDEWINLVASGIVTLPPMDSSSDYVVSMPINLERVGRLYKITLDDYAGNTTEAFIKILGDTSAPSFTTNPTVTPTKGSIGNYDGNYYFNEMSLSFVPKDIISGVTTTNMGVGTKEYSIVSGTTAIKSTTSVADNDTVNLTNAQAGFASHTNGSLYVRLTDKLENAKDYDLYLSGGTKVEVPWIRDTEKPTVSGVEDKEYVGARIVTVTETKTLYYTPKVRSYETDYSNNEFNVIVNATDTLDGTTTGKVKGYFVSTSETLADYSPITNPYTSLVSADSDNKATLKIKPKDYFASGTVEGNAYIYAVDYANNISQSFTLQIKKDPNKPVISNVSFDNAVTDVPGTTKYFNSTSKVSFDLRDNSVSIYEYGFYYLTDFGSSWTKVGSKSESIAKQTTTNCTLNMSALPTTGSFWILIYATNYNRVTSYYLLPVDIDRDDIYDTDPKWTYDATVACPTAVLSPAENVKTHPRAGAVPDASISNGGTLYYNQIIASSTVDLTVTFPADPTGIKGYKLYNGTTLNGEDTFETPLAAGSSGTRTISINPSDYVTGTTGTLKICSVDGLGNVTALADAFTLNLSKVTAASNIESVAVTKNGEGAKLYPDTATGYYYYNGATESLTLTPTMATTDLTGIVGFTTSSTATAPDTQSSATDYSKAALSDDGVDTVTLYAVNGVGCLSSTGTTVTLIRDSAAPTVSSIVIANSEEFSVNPDSSETLYYNPEKVTLTVSATDSPSTNNSGVAKYALSTDSELSSLEGLTWQDSLTLPSDASAAQFYVYVKDNVDNVEKNDEGKFVPQAFAGFTKYTPLGGTVSTAPAGAKWTADSTAPSATDATIALTSATNGDNVYLENNTSTTLFYKLSSSIELTPSLGSPDSSLMGYMLTENGTAANPTVTVASLSDNGTVDIYAVDYAGNKTKVYTLTTKSAATVPEIASVEVKALNDSDEEQLCHIGADGHYYGETTTKVRITPKFATDTDTSLIAGFRLEASLVDPAAYYDYTAKSADGSETINLVAVNKVGAESETYPVTLVRDTEAPTKGTLAFVISGTSGHSINADSSNMLYYNPGYVIVACTGAATDTVGIAGYIIDNNATVASSATGWQETYSTLTSTPEAPLTLPVYLHAKDNLGNVLNLSLAGNAKYVGYDGSENNVTTTLTWTSDTDAPDTPESFTLKVGDSELTDGEGVHWDVSDADAKKLYYSASVLPSGTTSVVFTPAPDSSVIGWSLKNDGTGIGSTVTVDLADNSSVSIYAVNYAGNFSSPYAFTLVEKNSLAAITYDSEGTFKVQTAADEFAYYYTGASVKITSADAIKYAISNANTIPTASSSWSTIPEDKEIDLSGLTETQISTLTGTSYLFAKDFVGNTQTSVLRKYVVPTLPDGGFKYYIESDKKTVLISNLPANFTLKSISTDPGLPSLTTYTIEVNKVSGVSTSSSEFETAVLADGGTIKITAGQAAFNSDITVIKLTDGNGNVLPPNDYTETPEKLTASPGFNILSVPVVFTGGITEKISTFLPRGRSISHEELMIQNEAILSRAKKNAAKSAASSKADLTQASAVTSSTEGSAWSGLSREFDSDSQNLDRSVSMLRAAGSKKLAAGKTVPKVMETAGVVEPEAKVSVTESVSASESNAASVSVGQTESAEKPFRKIGLLILLAVFVLSGAFFAKKVEIFHKKS